MDLSQFWDIATLTEIETDVGVITPVIKTLRERDPLYVYSHSSRKTFDFDFDSLAQGPFYQSRENETIWECPLLGRKFLWHINSCPYCTRLKSTSGWIWNSRSRFYPQGLLMKRFTELGMGPNQWWFEIRVVILFDRLHPQAVPIIRFFYYHRYAFWVQILKSGYSILY